MKTDDIKAVVLLLAIGAAGYVGWRAYRTGRGVLETATQAAQQAAATVTSAWNNNVATPFAQGRLWAETGEVPYAGEKAFLYSDYGYTGNDPVTGQPVIEGEWYSDAEARRYTAEQIQRGAQPAATSINGAAFGFYPSAPRRTLSDAAAAAARAAFAANDPRRLDL